ncbi:MAG: DNA-binding protein [Opitutae bacterium]|nr:DNA-binding protein [Opitutae bacterium]
MSHIGLEETLLGGQSFSWTATTESSWKGVIGKSVVELRLTKDRLTWRTGKKHPFAEKKLRNYLWLDPSFAEAVDSLPWRSDPVLDRCMKALPGLRILRQPMDEVLLVFLLSSVKSIPQIKEMKELVARKYGEPLELDLWSFPGWERLAEIPEAELRDLKMGYRAKYVHGVARQIAINPSMLREVVEQPYEEAKAKLLGLPGVGPKVADCCLLFGASRTNAFPIDTWISKTLEMHYGLGGWSNNQQAHFAFKHYGKHAGLAQQFLFSGERLGLHEKA